MATTTTLDLARVIVDQADNLKRGSTELHDFLLGSSCAFYGGISPEKSPGDTELAKRLIQALKRARLYQQRRHSQATEAREKLSNDDLLEIGFDETNLHGYIDLLRSQCDICWRAIDIVQEELKEYLPQKSREVLFSHASLVRKLQQKKT